MIHLHHAERLEPLLDALAEVLRTPVADPFTPDVVVVPAAGIQDAVQVGLGRRLGDVGDGFGVCANVEFMFPGRFIATALGNPTSAAENADPWRLPRLAWTVLEELHEGVLTLPGHRLRADGWPLARRIADLLDRYASQRPALIEAWAKGIPTDGTVADGHFAKLGEGHGWQIEWWKAVRLRLGRPSPPEQLPRLLAAFQQAQSRPDLPERLSVFGVGGLPPTLLGVLEALAEVRDVHVFLKHPSMAAWQGASHVLPPGLHVRDRVDIALMVRHPLLASWGRPSLEARALLRGNPAIRDEPCGAGAGASPATSSATSSATLLGAIQHAIRSDTAPAKVPGLAGADGSFQVHACHGRVRQLEALRDALGHAFVADPTLHPSEVLVLCPDLEAFAPLVVAVFQRGDLPVPVRVGDRSLTTEDPLVRALQTVLQVASGRATLTEVLGLAQFEPVRRRFGWTVEDVQRLAGWCVTLGTRWGLSADHRAPWGLSDVAEGTWQSMIDQLLAGVAMQAPTPRAVLGDLSPFDDLSTDDMSLVGSVAELLAHLTDLHAAVQASAPIEWWVALLRSTLDVFTAVAPAESWRCQQIRRQLDDIVAAAADGDRICAVPLTLADIRSLLSESLHDRAGRLALRTGSVTVSSLVPQHGVAARVICLLGLDDGALRGGTFDGDDILGLHPCIGERHPRHDTRQVLLDALLDAGERFIVTCNGADLTTNQPVPFVVPLVELLDVVAATADAAPADDTPPPWVVRHPRHGFNERALQPGALVRQSTVPFTFDSTMLAAATARRSAGGTESRPHGSPWSLPGLAVGTVFLDGLADAVTSPSKVFLRERLQVALPSDADALSDELPVAVDPLKSSSLGRELLDARRQGSTAAEWAGVVRLRGDLPPGELSTVALNRVVDEITELEATAASWGLPLAPGTSLPVDLLIPVSVDGAPDQEVRIQGDLLDVFVVNGSARLASVRYSRPRPSFRLAAAVRVAAAHLARPDLSWSAVIVSRGEGSKTTAGMGVQLAGAGDALAAHARQLLAMAVQLNAWARRDAVPFFDRASLPLFKGALGTADTALSDDLEFDAYATLLWPNIDIDTLLQLPPLPTDPAAIGGADRPAASRAMLTAQWVWGTFAACIDEFDVTGAIVSANGDDGAGDDE